MNLTSGWPHGTRTLDGAPSASPTGYGPGSEAKTFPTVSPRIIYDNNPLEIVVCQLRFPLILRIGSEEPAGYQERVPAGYTDRVRDRYPLLHERPALDLGLALPPTLGLPADIAKLLNAELAPAMRANQIVYDFRTADEAWTVTLARDFLSVTTKRYRRWEEFRGHLGFVLQALIEEYSPAFFTRLGLRYRDVIRRSALGLQSVPWAELLTPYIAAELSSPDVASSVPHAVHQVTIALDGETGQVRLQHALLTGTDPNDAPYLIDADFFTDQRTETNDALDRLGRFNHQAFRLFRWCITERIHSALGPARSSPWDLVLTELWSRTSSDWTKDALEIRDIIGVRPFQETGEELYEPTVALGRYVCHFLVERMPDRGLPELCRTMADYFEFYTKVPNARLALAAAHHSIRGVVREVRPASPFTIPSEEE